MPEPKEKPEKPRSLCDKLLWVQSELKSPKKRRNTFANFDYRSCEDILEAVKPLLKKIEVTLILTDEIIQVGDRYYIKSNAMFGMSEGNSDIKAKAITVTAYAREPDTKKGMDEMQLTGATSSYARKYALNGLFAIDDARDVDADKPNNNRPIDKSLELVDKAFEEFRKAHQLYLDENEGVELSKDKFTKAIQKQFNGLPTMVESIAKIVKEIKLTDVIEDPFDAKLAEGKDA